MTRMRPRERKLLIATIVLAVLAALQIAVVRPALGKMRRLTSKAKISAQSVQRMRTIVADREHVASTYDAIRSRIASARSPEREIIDMLLSVQEAAKHSGVEILQNEHLGDEPFEYFSRHTVRFRGAGKTENHVRMLYALQNPDLLLKVRKMRLAMKNRALEMELEVTRVVYSSEGDEREDADE